MVIPDDRHDEVVIGREWFVLTRNGYVCLSSGDDTAATYPKLDPECEAARLVGAWGQRLPELIAALQRIGGER